MTIGIKELSPEEQKEYRQRPIKKWIELYKNHAWLLKALGPGNTQDWLDLFDVQISLLKELGLQSMWLGLVKADLYELKEQDPKMLKEILSKIEPEIILAGLALEQRLAGLTPEDRQKLRELLNQRPSKEDQ
jgi:hypothetical protein